MTSRMAMTVITITRAMIRISKGMIALLLVLSRLQDIPMEEPPKPAGLSSLPPNPSRSGVLVLPDTSKLKVCSPD